MRALVRGHPGDRQPTPRPSGADRSGTRRSGRSPSSPAPTTAARRRSPRPCAAVLGVDVLGPTERARARGGAHGRRCSPTPSRPAAVASRARRSRPNGRRPSAASEPRAGTGPNSAAHYDVAVATHDDPALRRPGAQAARRRPSTSSTADSPSSSTRCTTTMYDAHGVGLAATQVGVQQRFFVYDDERRQRPACGGESRDRRAVWRVDLRGGLPLAARARASRSCARSS